MPSDSKSLHVVVNSRCNNNCLFCMETNAHKMYIPTHEEAAKIFKRVRHRADGILFTGPEPTVNKYLYLYIKAAQAAGYRKIRLITNGRMIQYNDFADELFNSGLSEISVSLHGSKHSVHDALTRTPGSFNETITGCRNLARLKGRYPFRWIINFTLTSLNGPDLGAFFNLVSSLKKVDAVVINSVIPYSNALRFFDSLISSYKEHVDLFREALSQYKTLKNGQRSFHVSILGIPPCLLKECDQDSSTYESILMNARTRALTIKEGRRHPKIKGPSCLKCRLHHQCSGVWRNYIAKKGFSEFMPVK